MSRARETHAQQQRIRRATALALSRQEREIRRKNLRTVLHLMRMISLDEGFISVISSHGATSIPEVLAFDANAPIVDFEALVSNEEYGSAALDFVVAWRFFFSVFQVPEIASYLEKKWPSFISDVKDVFIAIVMHGPIPGERRMAMKETYFR